MRYIHSIYQTLPMFAVFGVMLGAGGASNGIWRPLVGGATAGAVLGVWAFWLLRRKLVGGKEHWTMREVPGGIWFFLGLGLLLAVAGIKIKAHDEGLAVDLGLALCVLFFTGFTLVGIGIRREEKRHNMEVWLGPGGPEFRPPE